MIVFHESTVLLSQSFSLKISQRFLLNLKFISIRKLCLASMPDQLLFVEESFVLFLKYLHFLSYKFKMCDVSVIHAVGGSKMKKIFFQMQCRGANAFS